MMTVGADTTGRVAAEGAVIVGRLFAVHAGRAWRRQAASARFAHGMPAGWAGGVARISRQRLRLASAGDAVEGPGTGDLR
jgi:hypothetical protein